MAAVVVCPPEPYNAPMKRPTARWIRPTLLAWASLFFLAGLDWGLPSPTVDPYLFGATRQPWSGETIKKLAGDDDGANERGSDVAARPLLDRSAPIILNSNDVDRARIIRRYRLYSNQPDEMITFRALSRMRPGRDDFDPRFFQYGGAWVYPVGAMLKVASLFRLVQIHGDVAFYLDHPEVFGRYYVVARLYSAAWGLLGVLLMFELSSAWTGRDWAGVFAGAIYGVMPVVVNAAHEAKPHLAGSVLVLATLWAATRFLDGGNRKWAWLAAVSAGLAVSMVWTAAIAVAVLPVMVWLAPPLPRRLRYAVVLVAGSVAVFIVCNPYLPIDLIARPGVVFSNVGNSTAMYHPGLSFAAITHSVRLVGDAMNPMVALGGVVSLIWLATRRRATVHPAWLGVLPALLVAGQFVLLARDKPAEYARFSLTLDLLLVIALAAAVASIRSKVTHASCVLGLLLLVGGSGAIYLWHFVEDRGDHSTRLQVAQRIAETAGPIYIHAEPAPYCLPPVNLFDRDLVLLPPGAVAPAGSPAVEIIALDDVTATSTIDELRRVAGWSMNAPISWADKPFAVGVRVHP